MENFYLKVNKTNGYSLRSVLLRTVHRFIICLINYVRLNLLVYSVIERTPEKLLREVILVDDFSDMEHTKKPLEEYMGQFPKVKVKTHAMIKYFIFIPLVNYNA